MARATGPPGHRATGPPGHRGDVELAASDAEAQLARPTAAKDPVGWHDDFETIAAPVVPALQNPTTGSRSPGGFIRCELRKTGYTGAAGSAWVRMAEPASVVQACAALLALGM